MRHKPWFWALVGATLYLIGVNDAVLDWIAGWWLDLPEWLQTAIAVALIGLALYFFGGYLRRRRAAYRAAVRSAQATHTTASTVGSHHAGEGPT